jgi:hypothetical protein
MPAHLIYGDGVVLRAVQQVTLANAAGELRVGWIPDHAAAFVDDSVVIGARVFTVITIGAAVPHPTNTLPRWFEARPWIDPDDQCAAL